MLIETATNTTPVSAAAAPAEAANRSLHLIVTKSSALKMMLTRPDNATPEPRVLAQRAADHIDRSHTKRFVTPDATAVHPFGC